MVQIRQHWFRSTGYTCNKVSPIPVVSQITLSDLSLLISNPFLTFLAAFFTLFYAGLHMNDSLFFELE